jgi:hypothetical protein
MNNRIKLIPKIIKTSFLSERETDMMSLIVGSGNADNNEIEFIMHLRELSFNHKKIRGSQKEKLYNLYADCCI